MKINHSIYDVTYQDLDLKNKNDIKKVAIKKDDNSQFLNEGDHQKES